MSDFSKGKWLLNKHFDVHTEDGRFVALCCVRVSRRKNDNIYNKETKANARLIAAAPEMYNWLKAFLKISKDGTTINTRHIKELLARIDGEIKE